MPKSKSKVVQLLMKYVIENGSDVLLDAIKFHIKNKTDFAKTFSNRLKLRALASRVKKLKDLTDADAYLLGYMIMVYAQETNGKRAIEAFEYFNDNILKKIDTLFKEE